MGGVDITAGVELDCSIWGPSELELQLTVAPRDGLTVDDDLRVEVGGEPVGVTEASGEVGTRVHFLRPGDGRMSVRYEARISGGGTGPRTVSDWEMARFRRPSRYCESDRVGNLAADIVGDSRDDPGAAAVRVSDWVAGNFVYTPGVTTSVDTAGSVLLSRRGVCRDYTHTVIALLRSLGVPARYVCVYAPGCWPMDLHAVAEVAVDGRWYVVDASRLAPRQSLVRVATGMDAADVSFLTNFSGICNLHSITVHAAVDGELPVDDHTGLVPAP